MARLNVTAAPPSMARLCARVSWFRFMVFVSCHAGRCTKFISNKQGAGVEFCSREQNRLRLLVDSLLALWFWRAANNDHSGDAGARADRKSTRLNYSHA